MFKDKYDSIEQIALQDLFNNPSLVKTSKGDIILPKEIIERSKALEEVYQYNILRQRFFRDRREKDGIAGRFDSVEDRLNCIEDELRFVYLVSENTLTEAVDSAEAFKRDLEYKFIKLRNDSKLDVYARVELLREELEKMNKKIDSRFFLGLFCGAVLSILIFIGMTIKFM